MGGWICSTLFLLLPEKARPADRGGDRMGVGLILLCGRVGDLFESGPLGRRRWVARAREVVRLSLSEETAEAFGKRVRGGWRHVGGGSDSSGLKV